MRIVTPPGCNLSPALIGRYQVALTPQRIEIDGRPLDTRQSPVSLATIDRCVASTNSRPHMLSTSPAEFMEVFKDIAKTDRQIIALMTGRRVIHTIDAAITAAELLKSMPGYDHVEIAIVDTTVVDVGLGMATILAGECMKGGLSLVDTVATVNAFCSDSVLGLTVGSLDLLAKSGRAAFLRAWVADKLDRMPMLTMNKGEVRSASTYPRAEDPVDHTVEFIANRIGPNKRVWLGITHTNDFDKVRRLREGLGKRMTIVYELTREMHPSVYMHLGAGALAAFAFPIDTVPRMPSPPTG